MDKVQLGDFDTPIKRHKPELTPGYSIKGLIDHGRAKAHQMILDELRAQASPLDIAQNKRWGKYEMDVLKAYDRFVDIWSNPKDHTVNQLEQAADSLRTAADMLGARVPLKGLYPPPEKKKQELDEDALQEIYRQTD